MAMVIFSPPALAQDTRTFSQQELDQMLAPIALYPDPLLSQVLMAATYPLEVVEAERWTLSNPGLHGTQAVQAVQTTYWDPSVQSLVAFPQILSMLSRRLTWTERLGDAFLAEPDQVMDTVQALRQRAYAAGNLRSNDYLQVQSQDGSVLIMPVDPMVGYEPYYDPRLVYGSWWWPDYPPVYWSAWPGYIERPGFGNGFLWGAGIALGADFFFGSFDWHQHYIHVGNPNHDVWNHFPPAAGPNRSIPWRHNPDHRRGVSYSAPEVRNRFAPAGTPAPSRGDYRGHLPPPGAVPRPAPREQAVPAQQAPPRQPTLRTFALPVRPDRPYALEGIGRAPDVRQSSERGRASMQAPPSQQAPQGARQMPGRDRKER
jgi:hypothetical protein